MQIRFTGWKATAMVAVLVAGTGLGFSSAAYAGSVKVPKSIEIASTAGATPAVESECKLQTQVPAYLAEASTDVELVDGKPKSGRYLTLEITQVHAPGGGIFSGPKWLEVSGTLKDGGKTVGKFRVKRASAGGPFGQFKGTCGILNRCAKTIGQDIAAWLANPVDSAELGDAR